jgi:hypothetical protein
MGWFNGCRKLGKGVPVLDGWTKFCSKLADDLGIETNVVDNETPPELLSKRQKVREEISIINDRDAAVNDKEINTRNYRDVAVNDKGIFLLNEYEDDSRNTILLIPGFLNEKRDRYDLPSMSNQANRWKSNWVRRFLDESTLNRYNVFIVNWPSSTLNDVLYTLFDPSVQHIARYLQHISRYPLLQKILPIVPQVLEDVTFAPLLRAINSYRHAVEAADESVSMVEKFLEERKSRTIVVSHSIGSRIALKVFEKFGNDNQSLDRFYVALAPAIGHSELKIDSLSSSYMTHLDLYYSVNDFILSFWYQVGQFEGDSAHDFLSDFRYRVGQLEGEPALGYEGAPKGSCLSDRCFKVSNRENGSRMSHFDYEKDVRIILEESSEDKSSAWSRFNSV